MLGEHQHHRRDTTADAGNEHGLARPHLAAGDERPVGSQSGEGQGSGLGPGEVGGLGHDVRGGDDDLVGVGAVVGHAENAVVGALSLGIWPPAEAGVDDDTLTGQLGCDAGTDRRDHAGPVRTEHTRQPDAAVLAEANPHVTTVQGGGFESDYDLAGRGGAARHLTHGQGGGTVGALFGQHHCAHRAGGRSR